MADAFAHERRVLANAACKDQRVEPTQRGCIGANKLPGRVAEERHRIGLRKRWHRVLLLTVQVKRLTARHEHLQGVALAQQRSDVERGRQDLLEVVEQQKSRSVANKVGQRRRNGEFLAK